MPSTWSRATSGTQSTERIPSNGCSRVNTCCVAGSKCPRYGSATRSRSTALAMPALSPNALPCNDFGASPSTRCTRCTPSSQVVTTTRSALAAAARGGGHGVEHCLLGGRLAERPRRGEQGRSSLRARSRRENTRSLSMSLRACSAAASSTARSSSVNARSSSRSPTKTPRTSSPSRTGTAANAFAGEGPTYQVTAAQSDRSPARSTGWPETDHRPQRAASLREVRR